MGPVPALSPDAGPRRHRGRASAIGAFALALCALCLLAAQGASGRASHTHARSSSAFVTGIGDEHTEMFTNPLWLKLHMRIVRYIAPYDAAERPYSLKLATEWIHDAEADHVQVLVAFYHSEYTATRLPSVATYRADVARFIALFPHVSEYEAYDEANRGNQPGAYASPSAARAAQYYQALLGVCKGCTVVGLDVLDSRFIASTLRYIAAFKREVRRLHTAMPAIWGLHDYSDVNRLQSWRTRKLTRALGHDVWLTETGGIVHLGKEFRDVRGSGLLRAARVLKFTFALAASQPAIKRVYLYDWTGSPPGWRFDAGLTDSHYGPRPGYVVVCRELHAGSCTARSASR